MPVALSSFVFWYLLAINLITLVIFGADKISATSGSWRIRERTLFLLSLLGGSLGAIVAIKFFRHKSSKASFLAIMALIFLAQLALLLFTLQSIDKIPDFATVSIGI